MLILTANAQAYDVTELQTVRQKLLSLDSPVPKPEKNDWLANHKEEGQTLEEYLNLNFRLEDEKKYIYIQPIGKFSKEDRRVLSYVAEYLQIFYGMKTKIKADISADLVIAQARRHNPLQRNLQFSAVYIIDEILEKRKPSDAAAYVGFTATDLWPGDGWNYVFGLATPDNSLGVWSLARLRSGRIEAGVDSVLLLRAAKLASHEVGHMFAMKHNKDNKCLMNGANHLQETDRSPLYLSANYLPMLLSFSDVDVYQRYTGLQAWCKKFGFDKDAEAFFKRSEIFKN